MKKGKLVSLLGIALTSTIVLAACGGGSGSDKASDSASKDSSGKMAKKQELNLIESAEIPIMDSVMNTDTVGSIVMNNVFEGLYRQDLDNNPVLGMAAEEPKISDDKLTYTFKIRDDAKWSNGDPVTAGDFVFSWRRLVDPTTAAPYSYMMDGVIANASAVIAGEKQPDELGVKAVDDKTLEIQLERAVPYFKGLLSLAMYYPQNEKFVTEQGEKYASNSDALVYNGPFKLAAWDGTGLSWEYDKNDTYWDKDTVKLDKINVDVVKETSTALNLYDDGQIDRMVLTGEYVQTRQDDPDLKKFPTSSVFFLKFNQERNGKATPLANENIRKALSMAFDKQAYADTVLQNGSVPANGLVPAGLAKDPKNDKDFRKENGDLSKYDAKKAQEFWKKGLKELGVDKLDLEFLSDDTENAKRSSEFMQGQLEENLDGLKITLRNVPFKVRIDNNDKQDYDIQLSGWGADFSDPINFLELFETGNGNNKSGFSNEKYDSLLKEISTTSLTDPEKRWEQMLEAEKVLFDNGAIAPIYQRYWAVLEKPTVKDIGYHLVGADYSYKWTYLEDK
ncbi:peptide ABC transporter substrate-binding protein [Carnobacterium maltaromaticum]|uniref:peptide ABC transporter substrate-binding protein n=1 Tax=Carnobacterium maltaromaticum TaxID=2751 RepID=UPI000C786336|nr:peptide ABC transporter substrate-binding protein [Carnobacterium maltaromaticum]PLS33826.1 peptide ABC transporter substrate-binding protein [Carnobacterium maltaromaticum]PLS35807.1 peptide ABC transporter substrate-binding protein [Carnobacterium maltaromaticum]PLS36257.1 peptide ABC transporter substrate-binding protein [Carnobacterium maltaromaticum]PLS42714.1 peptide ABC transporter substrate-binding protein [Carnobacterium maltaromaticum]PLS42950.1 peptide ABC transporter substrate-b